MGWVFLDLETRSRVNIKECGGHVYVRDSSTEILCGVAVVVHDDGSSLGIGWSDLATLRKWSPHPDHVRTLGFDPGSLTWETWAPGDVRDLFHDLAEAGYTFVAHNGEGFDRPFLEGRGWVPDGAVWLDTMHRARQSGLPAGLDAIGDALYQLGKDKKGQQTLRLLMRPHAKTGEYIPPRDGTLSLVARYCARDVLLMAAAFYEEGWDDPHHDDPVREVHCKIDRRGIPVDLDLAKRILSEAQADKQRWLDKAAEFGVCERTLRSSTALPKKLAELGFAVENVQKATLERLLSGDVPEEVRTLCEARLAFNRVTEGKAIAALRQTCPDGRMRGTLAYWGAHTGRWAGRGLQVQNLPAPVKGFTVDAYDADTPKVAADLGVAEADVLGSMLRGLLVAEPGRMLAQVDYNQIEARVLQWLAGAEDALDVFRQGRDPYKVAAGAIYRVPEEQIEKGSLERTVGKIATLALGYQGGPGSLSAFAEVYGLDLEAEGIDADEVVNAWRDANEKIAGTRKGPWRTPEGRVVIVRQGGLWKDYQAAAMKVVENGGAQTAGRCRFSVRDGHLIIRLPSGRELVYRNAAVEPTENQWGGVTNALVFDSVRHGKVCREATYGGRISENLCQAVARDIMAEAMVKLDAAGLYPLFTVHDEILVSVPDEKALDRVVRIMCERPGWALDLPLKAEGEVGGRYGK